MIKYLVPRISQEIFVFPSEYFLYSTFHALFCRALWGKSTNILHALPFRRSNFSSSRVPWTPTDSEGVQDTVHLPRLEPSMINERTPPRTAFQQEGAWLCHPGIPLTGAGFGHAELHNGFRLVQKGAADTEVPQERRGTTVQHNARCYNEVWTVWYACASGFEAHFYKKKKNLKSRLNTYFTQFLYLPEIFL